MIAENSSSATNYYTWGLDLSQSLQSAGGVGGLLAQITDNGSAVNCHYAVADANGNVTDYVSTNGTIAAHYEYDPYGNITQASGLMPEAFTHRFSSKYFDVETGLSYYGFRYYSPQLGRWLNRDPIEEAGGISLYLHCDNNSINSYDILGNTSCLLKAAMISMYNGMILNKMTQIGFNNAEIGVIAVGMTVLVTAKTITGAAVTIYSATLAACLEIKEARPCKDCSVHQENYDSAKEKDDAAQANIDSASAGIAALRVSNQDLRTAISSLETTRDAWINTSCEFP